MRVAIVSRKSNNDGAHGYSTLSFIVNNTNPDNIKRTSCTQYSNKDSYSADDTHTNTGGTQGSTTNNSSANCTNTNVPALQQLKHGANNTNTNGRQLRRKKYQHQLYPVLQHGLLSRPTALPPRTPPIATRLQHPTPSA